MKAIWCLSDNTFVSDDVVNYTVSVIFFTLTLSLHFSFTLTHILSRCSLRGDWDVFTTQLLKGVIIGNNISLTLSSLQIAPQISLDKMFNSSKRIPCFFTKIILNFTIPTVQFITNTMLPNGIIIS